eukprot:1408328-Prymnesium_polylepis.1
MSRREPERRAAPLRARVGGAGVALAALAGSVGRWLLQTPAEVAQRGAAQHGRGQRRHTVGLDRHDLRGGAAASAAEGQLKESSGWAGQLKESSGRVVG